MGLVGARNMASGVVEREDSWPVDWDLEDEGIQTLIMTDSVTPVKDDIDRAPAAQDIVVDNRLRGGTA